MTDARDPNRAAPINGWLTEDEAYETARRFNKYIGDERGYARAVKAVTKWYVRFEREGHPNRVMTDQEYFEIWA